MGGLPAVYEVELYARRLNRASLEWLFCMKNGEARGGRRGLIVVVLAVVGIIYIGWKEKGVERLVGALPAPEFGYSRTDPVGAVSKPLLRAAEDGGVSGAAGSFKVAAGGDNAPTDFEEAKKLMRQVYKDHRQDEYCGCGFDGSMRVDGACGVANTGFPDRELRIEWEHVVPAADFGRQRECWRDAPSGVSGRQNCRSIDADFRLMEANPYNLLPVVGGLNALRSSYRMGEVAGEAREYGSCDFELSGGGTRFVEPPDWIKGDVARIYFYFERVYGYRIGRSQQQLFAAWDEQDPLDEWEFKRAVRIFKATGLDNPVVTERMEQRSGAAAGGGGE